MKYEITATQLQGSILLTYNEQGTITIAEFNCTLTTEQRTFIATHFPVLEQWLNKFTEQFKAKAQIINEQITFEQFYEAYGNKKGKEKAKATWNKLSKTDQAKAFAYIKKYNNYLVMNPWQAKLMPVTYLNQKRWND